MPRLTKEKREGLARCSARASKTVQEYMRSKVCDTIPDAITDSLTDMMHFCVKWEIDFDNQLRIARNHFWCERNGVD